MTHEALIESLLANVNKENGSVCWVINGHKWSLQLLFSNISFLEKKCVVGVTVWSNCCLFEFIDNCCNLLLNVYLLEGLNLNYLTQFCEIFIKLNPARPYSSQVKGQTQI